MLTIDINHMNPEGHPDARENIMMELKCYGMLANMIYHLMKVAQALEIRTIKSSSICLILFQMQMYMNFCSMIKKVISEQYIIIALWTIC